MSRFKSALVCLAFYCFVLAGLALSERALAQQGFQKTYDWTIDLETDAVKGRLEYPGSKLNNLNRVKVFYHKGAKVEASKRTHYEDLWYQEDQIVGCRRDHKFTVKAGEHVAIRVRHASGASSGQAQAAADAIIRLVLDSYANGSMTSAVFVPADSFNEIVQRLGRLNFYPAGAVKPDQQVYTIMVLNLYSEPEGSQQTLHYAGETAAN